MIRNRAYQFTISSFITDFCFVVQLKISRSNTGSLTHSSYSMTAAVLTITIKIAF